MLLNIVFNKCGDATKEFLLAWGTLLRNFNERGDTTEEFLLAWGRYLLDINKGNQMNY